jgi:hypothetical protein
MIYNCHLNYRYERKKREQGKAWARAQAKQFDFYLVLFLVIFSGAFV